MMLERIGIMGNTQGVNVSSRPNPKKLSNTSKLLPLASERAIRSCSGSSTLAAADGSMLGCTGSGLPLEGPESWDTGSLRLTRLVMGG